MGVPLNHPFIARIFPYKPSMLGYPHGYGTPQKNCQRGTHPNPNHDRPIKSHSTILINIVQPWVKPYSAPGSRSACGIAPEVSRTKTAPETTTATTTWLGTFEGFRKKKSRVIQFCSSVSKVLFFFFRCSLRFSLVHLLLVFVLFLFLFCFFRFVVLILAEDWGFNMVEVDQEKIRGWNQQDLGLHQR